VLIDIMFFVQESNIEAHQEDSYSRTGAVV